ncbi:MAG: YifB family Mg chelatase-like AAA ATPase [Synechococcus sp.]|nr:YifB family Mg chelatase-like AAA ATPase [Synechococcus sp.]
MLAHCCTAALCGLEAQPVCVEVDLAPGLPLMQLVGLADASGRDARERLRSALRNSGFRVPQTRVVANLAPADLPKQGAGFDLPLALALLVASTQLAQQQLQGIWAIGELALDGRLLPVHGVLAVAAAAAQAGAKALLVPQANAAEARLVEALPVWAADGLSTAVRALQGAGPWSPLPPAPPEPPLPPMPDLAAVCGQRHGRRSLELAAAGAHHLLLIGPPGCGKTLLARCLPGLLPPLTPRQALLISQIHALAGLRPAGSGLLRAPPLRMPHHGCSAAALVGGGSGPRPGEVSLAHHGVLFLDELAEFKPAVLDQLRQPLEQGEIQLARARQLLRLPARVQLVAATNPCPCGWWGDPQRGCRCGEQRRRQYWGRLSGPLLDRIPLQVVLSSAQAQLLQPAPAAEPSESTAQVAERVQRARQRMAARNPGGAPNGALAFEQLQPLLQASAAAQTWWRQLQPGLGLSSRAQAAVFTVARTAADLEASTRVEVSHLAEALTYRGLDRGVASP